MGVYLRGDVWYLRWRDVHGRKRRRATTARGEREAERLLVEVEGNVQRQRLGLDPMPVQSAGSGSLWELCAWWLKSRCSPESLAKETARLEKHVKRTWLGDVELSQVTDDVLAKYLEEMEKGGAAPGTVNRLRTQLSAIFSEASKPPRRWTGPNPVRTVPVREVHQQVYATLRAEEVDSFLFQVPERWQGFFATGIYRAFRKGEICGLLKDRVDLASMVVLVANSYLRNTTKGGHSDGLPIPPDLVPYFREALKTPGPWMFPNLMADATGRTMLTEDANPEKICRTAQKSAGIVTKYHHHCRRCGHARRPRGGGEPVRSQFAPHVEEHPDDAARRCPQCDMKLWAEGVPRFRRFHDLRHSTATILLRRGVDVHKVQRILRHAKIETTIGTYGHLLVEDLREAAELAPRQAEIIELRRTGEAQETERSTNEAQPAEGKKKGRTQ